MTTAAIFGLAGPELTAGERAFLREARPWGLILFARNIASAPQLRRLVEEARAAVGRACPVLIDQEGGRVARLRPPLAHAFPPAAEDAARPAARRLFHLRGRIIAHDLGRFGIDVNCAPLADLGLPGTHAVLRDRCYGADPASVAANARAMAEGLAQGGVLPVLKHIPGHGGVAVDSHAALPRQPAGGTVLAAHFAPFRALADLPLGMTAHVVYPALDAARPATLSPLVIDHVRREIGFDGLLMSDDISMGALWGDVARRSAAARAAGCDLVLHCNGDLAEMEEVARAAGPLDAAARRREAALARWRAMADAAGDVDMGALIAEYEALRQRGPEQRRP